MMPLLCPWLTKVFLRGQVWNTISREFVSQNKYRGREVKRDEFKEVLRGYFFDGKRLLVEHIPNLVRKLYALAAIIRKLRGFRFYGCSLLMIYDGDEEVQDYYLQSRLETREAATATPTPAAVEPTQDEAMTGSKDQSSPTSATTMPTLRRSRSADGADLKKAGWPNEHIRKGECRIRIVDFAHPTTGKDFLPPIPDKCSAEELGKGYWTETDLASGLPHARFPPKHPNEPDMGFLFGIKNIVATLADIWHQEMERRREAGEEVVDLGGLSAGGALPSDPVFDELFPAELPTGYLST